LVIVSVLVQWFPPPTSAARAAKICRASGAQFLLVAGIHSMGVVGHQAWLGLVITLPLVSCGALTWATRSRVAAVIALLVGTAVWIDAVSLLFVMSSVGGFTLGWIAFACALPLAGIRGIQGAWGWHRLRRHAPSAELGRGG
jgi:hypothetical protein